MALNRPENLPFALAALAMRNLVAPRAAIWMKSAACSALP
jgi:hypothetical protein